MAAIKKKILFKTNSNFLGEGTIFSQNHTSGYLLISKILTVQEKIAKSAKGRGCCCVYEPANGTC